MRVCCDIIWYADCSTNLAYFAALLVNWRKSSKCAIQVQMCCITFPFNYQAAIYVLLLKVLLGSSYGFVHAYA